MKKITHLMAVFYMISIYFMPTSQASEVATSPQLITDSEREILNEGEIGTGAYVAGGAVGTLLGLGIGHAIQGRYTNLGWVFTVGETASAVALVYGASDCVVTGLGNTLNGTTDRCNSTLITLGYAGLLGFRLWEIIDLWAAPPSINNRYRNIKNRTENKGYSLFILPTKNESIVAGLQIRF